MNPKLQNGLLASLLALLCLSLTASATSIFAPFVLHPVRHEITAKEVTSR